MSLLKNLTTDASIADEKDFIGRGVLDSDLYLSTIKLAYVKQAASGAVALVVHAETADGRKIQEDLWMQSGTAKGGKNYYEKDGVKSYLPGYLIATSLTLLTLGKEISDVDTETKVVNVYSKEAKGDAPTKVEAVVDLIGQEVILGVIKEVVDKQSKVGESYVNTGETREQNVIDKVFRAKDNKTTFEFRNKIEDAGYYEQWKSAWQGKVRNKATNAPDAKPGAGAAGGGTKKPTTSLFAN